MIESLPTEHITEENEIAQVQDMIDTMHALAAHREKMLKQQSYTSLHECIECGDEIPEERRQAIKGCTMCVFCKEKSERR